METIEELKAMMDIALKPEFELAINKMIEKSYKADVEELGPGMAGLVKSQWEQMKPYLFFSYCLGVKAQAVPEWISMEDKYPKAGESVLICINGIRQNIAYFYDCSVSNEYSDHDWFEPVFTGGEAGDECVVKTEDVTHWMLLPKEPTND